jgi:hypothetical protein
MKLSKELKNLIVSARVDAFIFDAIEKVSADKKQSPSEVIRGILADHFKQKQHIEEIDKLLENSSGMNKLFTPKEGSEK